VLKYFLIKGEGVAVNKLIEYISKWLMDYGINKNLSLFVSNTITILIIIFIIVTAYLLTKKFIIGTIKTHIKRSKNKWDDILVKRKVLEQLAHIIPALVIHLFAPAFPVYGDLIERLAFSYIVVVVIVTIGKLLNVADDIYRQFEISREKPIKGYLQVFKIIVYIIGAIIVISVLTDRSPLAILGGIGAATAILTLVFQNSILGFVASIQLVWNNMLRIGDWIEMPKYGADGDVIEISIHTVKVQNWDKTIVTIPTHALISDSFKNWRGMREAGGRRIKRAIYIDMTSIKFCTEEMLERFKKIQYIQEYLESKIRDIEEYNRKNNIDTDNIVNGRHLTNIGTFRAYVENYIKNHPKLNKGMLQIVRQLQPTEKGLPLEIYTFTNDTAWINYESIQADIFDHILAVLPEFDLRIYQAPSGHDIKDLLIE
jgi:miniconductance mechanosensitive channel